MKLLPAIAAIALASFATAGEARPGLSKEAAINNGLFAVALAIEISDKCDRIDPRTFKGLAYLNTLKNDAESKGYSRDEIRAYVKSDSEKAKMRARGEAYVKSKGLNPKSAADLCKLGAAEIAEGSLTGSLLKAK